MNKKKEKKTLRVKGNDNTRFSFDRNPRLSLRINRSARYRINNTPCIRKHVHRAVSIIRSHSAFNLYTF